MSAGMIGGKASHGLPLKKEPSRSYTARFRRRLHVSHKSRTRHSPAKQLGSLQQTLLRIFYVNKFLGTRGHDSHSTKL